MKSLQSFIMEKLHMGNSKSISFNFNGIDGAKELIASLEGNDLVSIEDNTVTVNVTNSNYTKLASVKDILEAALKAERNGSKTTNDEQYAQKIKGLENKMDELNAAIESFNVDNSKEETPDAKKEADKDAKDSDKKSDDKEDE